MSFMFKAAMGYLIQDGGANEVTLPGDFNSAKTRWKWDFLVYDGVTNFAALEDQLALFSYANIKTGVGISAGKMRAHSSQTPQNTNTGMNMSITMDGFDAADPVRRKYAFTGVTSVVWTGLNQDSSGWGGRYVMLSYDHPVVGGVVPFFCSDAGDVIGKQSNGEDFTVDVPLLFEEFAKGVNAI